MRSVVVTGPSGPVGRRLVAHLGEGQARLADVESGELAGLLDGADTLVHLAWRLRPARRGGETTRANVDATRRLLVAADRAGIGSVVHVSSATVYGAWPDNPVPLTEEAALRPNPGFVDAVGRAEVERMVADWAADHPGAAVAVLRPATVLGPGAEGWLARALAGHATVRLGVNDPPRQFVHADDVVSAVALAVHQRLDGVYNVAPDGSVSGEVLRGLTAGRPSLPLPRRLAGAAARWAWSLHLSDLPPALLPLVEHPWVVANDRLRAVGWEPRHSSEEAVVAGRPGSWWREMSPARRQQAALAASGTALAAVGGAVATLVMRGRSRRPL